MDTIRSISYTEIEALNRCPRLWHYKYRQGLTPNRTDSRLGRGDVMHRMLAAHYRGEDWRIEWAEQQEKAMENVLLEDERDQVIADFQLYRGVMERYIAQDKLRPVWVTAPVVEEKMELPLPGGGSLVVKIDMLAIDEDGLMWVVDHKTVTDFDKNYEARADMDPQLSYYVWALRQKGMEVAGALHNYIRMRVPGEPALNKDGSMSAVAIITDEETVRAFVARTGAKEPKGGLEAYIAKLPRDAFFRQATAVRSDEELEAVSWEIAAKVRERELRVSEDLITRTITPDCVRCPFYKPCLTALKGGDEEAILAEFYRPRQDDEDGPMPVDYEGGE